MATDRKIKQLLEAGDDKLLALLGTQPYLQAKVLMVELENLVQDLPPDVAAQVLSTFQSMTALRYAERRRHGQT